MIYDEFITGTGPDLTSQNSSIVNASVGQSVVLECTAAESIAWYFNNVPMMAGAAGESGRLVFNSLALNDSGWYTCAAANQFGRRELDFLLVVVGECYIHCHN